MLTFDLSASAFNGKGIFSMDLEYLGLALRNNGWGLGLSYEREVTSFSSLRASFSHISLKPDSEHDWITTVGLGLDLRIYPFNQGLQKLYIGYGCNTDWLMFIGQDKKITYISQCPQIGWKQNFLDYVFLDAYFGYHMKTTNPGEFALKSGIIRHGIEYGIKTQLNIPQICRFFKSKFTR